jgi:hypothetical protein
LFIHPYRRLSFSFLHVVYLILIIYHVDVHWCLTKAKHEQLWISGVIRDASLMWGKLLLGYLAIKRSRILRTVRNQNRQATQNTKRGTIWCMYHNVLCISKLASIRTRLGMTTGRIRIGYYKYPPATISTVIDNIRPRLYPRVVNYICAHRVSDIHRIWQKTIFNNSIT